RTLLARSLKRSKGPISVPLSYISDEVSSGSDYTFASRSDTVKHGTLAAIGDPGGQREPSSLAVYADDPHRKDVADAHQLVRVGHAMRSKLADVDESFYTLGHLGERPVRHHPGDGRFDGLARLDVAAEPLPRIVTKPLD